MADLTEERLAEIQRDAVNDPYEIHPDVVLALLAEIRRLRTIEDEREEARSLLKTAVSYLYCHEAERVREWTLEMNRLFVKWADEDLGRMQKP